MLDLSCFTYLQVHQVGKHVRQVVATGSELAPLEFEFECKVGQLQADRWLQCTQCFIHLVFQVAHLSQALVFEGAWFDMIGQRKSKVYTLQFWKWKQAALINVSHLVQVVQVQMTQFGESEKFQHVHKPKK